MVPRRTTLRSAQDGRENVCMEPCVSCERVYSVRLFDVRIDGHIHRYWWCPACAFAAHRRGDVAQSPAWIERAALNQLPVKELLLESDRASSRTVTERRQGGLDRRRRSTQPRPPDRRGDPAIGQRTLDWRTGG